MSPPVRSAEDIIAECDDMICRSAKLNTVEKQMEWLDAQKQVDALGCLMPDGSAAWKDHYIQLIRMMVFLDPSKSMDVHRPYMDRLRQVADSVSEQYKPLQWYAYRKLSQLYLLDNEQTKAFAILEHIIADIQGRPTHSSQDSVNLCKAMVNQLFCSPRLPISMGQRNLACLQACHDNRIPLGRALFTKHHHRVIEICDSLLHTSHLRLIDQYQLFDILYRALQSVPPTSFNAKRMLNLLSMQDSMYMDVQHARNTDYTAYKEIQEQSRIKAELDKLSKNFVLRYARYGTILAILGVVLLLFLWYIYRQESAFKQQIVDRLRTERTARKAALTESRQAYTKQVELVRNLNHDIRVPLNALMGFSHILSETENLSDEEKNEVGSTIRQSSTQLLETINNLLAIARVETQKMSLKKRMLESDELLVSHEWSELVSRLAPTHELHVESGHSHVVLYTDDRHVRKIIELIITDIVRKTSENHIRVTSHVDATEQHLFICIDTHTSSLSVASIQEALSPNKQMSDYDDTQQYYLVLARMLTQLIRGHLELHPVSASTLQYRLILPLH